MRILLDTNAFIWLIGSERKGRLGSKAKRLISQADAVFVSSISIAEINIKMMLGKLPGPAKPSEALGAAGLRSLDFSSLHAEHLTSFPELTKHDPFDRIILAQAQAENLMLVTSDAKLLNLELTYIIDARE